MAKTLNECICRYGTAQKVSCPVHGYVQQFSEEKIRTKTKIAELERINETLRFRLKKANDQLARYQRDDSRRYRYENDYLPYEDDDRRGD